MPSRGTAENVRLGCATAQPTGCPRLHAIAGKFLALPAALVLGACTAEGAIDFGIAVMSAAT